MRSFETLRVGKKYRIINFGDTYEFEILKRLSDLNYVVKDLHTLETFELEEITRWGQGKDFSVDELR
jgi:hypothetical protein